MAPGASPRNRFLPLLLGWILLLGTSGASGQPDVDIGFHPLWEGHFLPGQVTEVEVRLLSDTGGPFKLVLHGGAAPVILRGKLEAGNPFTAWLPLYPRPGQAVTAILWLDGLEVSRKEIWFDPSSNPLAIWVQPLETDGSPSALPVPARQLPRKVDGYRSVGSLAISMKTLPQLDQMQLEALRNYVGNCGKLFLPEQDRGFLHRWKAMAGCGGRRIAILGMPLLTDTTPGSTQPLPVPSTDQSGTAIKPVIVLVVVYLLSLLLVILTRRRAAALIAIPLLGTTALLSFWPLQGNPARLSSWAETESGSRNIRYSASLQVTGIAGGDDLQIRVSSLLGSPGGTNSPPPVSFDSLHPEVETLAVPVRPFSHREYRFHGSLAAPFQLQLETANEQPTVIHRGGNATPAGFLGWRDTLYAVPPMAPGQKWQPSSTSAVTDPGELPPEIRKRCIDNGPALLLPMNLQHAGLVPSGSGLHRIDGWLMVRSFPGENP